MDTEKILERREGETDIQYHKRLLTAKLVDKTIDLDYSILSPYLYGKSYSNDVARRMAYGSLKTLKLLEIDDLDNTMEQDEPHTEDDIAISKLDQKIAEFQREKKKFYDQRREYNKLVGTDGRVENLHEALSRAAESLNETVGRMYGSASDPWREEEGAEAVLVLSDWHYGLVANNVFNCYNRDICKERVQKIISKAIDRIVLHGCTKLDVVILGDLFHGAIHTSARVASEELVCDQIMQVSEILAQSIYELSKWVEAVHVYMCYGNHGRTVQNKNDSIHRDNIERLIPWWLRERFDQCWSITVEPERQDEFALFTAKGHTFVASHGDIDNVKKSPQLLTTLFYKQFGQNVEYVLLGDKHHVESFEELGVTAMICGALCGADDYASNKRLFSYPSQLLLIVTEEDGVDAEYRISCD